MSGPGREWHPGNSGPRAPWADHTRHAQQAHNLGRPGSVVPPLAEHVARGVVQRMGRDPHDKVTRELPLEQPVEIDIVIRLKPMLEAGMKLAREGNDAASWLCLLHWAAGLESFE